MGLVSWFNNLSKRSNDFTGLSSSPQWPLTNPFGGPTKSGSNVTIESSFGNPTIWAAYRIISETVASFPLNLYIKDKDGSVHVMEDDPLNHMLSVEPNDSTDSFTHQETTQVDLESNGNCYERIFRSRRGNIEAIERLTVDRVIPMYRYDDNGRLAIKYKVTTKDLAGANKDEILDYDQVIHPKTMSKNGIIGRSPILTCIESVGMWEASRDFGAYYFANGATPSGILTTPTILKDEQIVQMLNIWKKYNGGAQNAGMPMITHAGYNYTPIQSNPADSKLIEMIKLSMEQVAQLFRIPQHLLGNLERATNSNIEQQTIDFTIHTIRPRVKRRENEYNRKLFLTPDARKKYFVRYNLDALLRGDTDSRIKMYQFLFGIGAMNADDVLAMEHRNKLPNGEGLKYFISQNLRPVDEILNAPDVAKPVDKLPNGDPKTP